MPCSSPTYPRRAGTCCCSARCTAGSSTWDKKPLVLFHYNTNKGGVKNLEKLLDAYTCRRMTRRWTAALFHNILDTRHRKCCSSSSSIGRWSLRWRSAGPECPVEASQRSWSGNAGPSPVSECRSFASRGQSARQVVMAVEEDNDQEQAQEDKEEAKEAEEEAAGAEEKKTQISPTRIDTDAWMLWTRIIINSTMTPSCIDSELRSSFLQFRIC
ncbi:hypothetical protein CRENBAI_014207 [Crenichthys baileyi]|uniref:PiggyBac transposable element-derived protein domain-containing protein n=1 Tax=Crenichthys baileyi TaxID=28760 RepID=A0AAV9QVR1_9TELE